MSDEPNVTTEPSEPHQATTVGSPTGEGLSTSKAETPHKAPRVGRYWWIPVTFIVPFVVIYEWLGSAAHSNLAACFRSGAIGVGVAVLISLLWSVDQKIQNQIKKPVGPLIAMLGMMLWLGWVVAAHVMVIAHDDAHYLAESETH